MVERLPVEVVTYILQFLGVSDRKEAALVCKHWYEASLDPILTKNMVTTVHIYSNSNLHGCPNLPHRRLSHLVLEHMDNSFYLKQLGERSNIILEELISLSLKGSQISERAFLDLVCQCPNLLNLDLTGCNSLFMSGQLFADQAAIHCLQRSQALLNLQELNLSSLRYLADSTFNRLMTACPNVSKLSIAGCQIVFHTDSYFQGPSKAGNTAVVTFRNLQKMLLERADRIKSLNLSHTSIADEYLIEISNVRGLHLEEISLVHCRDITSSGISQFCEQQPSIQSINLSECQDLTDQLPYSIAQHLQGVKKIKLKKCRQLTNHSIKQFSSLEELEHVDISECYNVTSDGVIHGLCSLKHQALTHVNVSSCVGVKDDFVAALCKSVPHLEHLDLGSCHSITDLSVHKISKYLTGLVYLRLAWCRHVSDFGLLGLVDENADYNHDDEGLCRCTRKSNVKNIFNKPALKPKAMSENELKDRECRLKVWRHEDEGFCISNLTHLHELDLSCCPKVTDASLKHALKFEELRKFSLSVNQNVNDETLVILVNNIPSLEYVDIGQCGRVTDDGVTYAALNLKRLSSINVTSCDLLTDAFILSLQDHASRLRNLDVSLCSGITAKAVFALEQSRKGNLTVKRRMLGANGQVI